MHKDIFNQNIFTTFIDKTQDEQKETHSGGSDNCTTSTIEDRVKN